MGHYRVCGTVCTVCLHMAVNMSNQTGMVHSCVVLGCKNRSNKEECKHIKFYTLPFKNAQLLKTWLSLIGRHRNEVTIHSRVCSVHFVDGMKKSDSTDISMAEAIHNIT